MHLTDLAFAPDDKSLADLFAARVAATPDAAAARYHEGSVLHTLTWRELSRRAETIAARLAAHGLGEGSIVGIFLPTGCAWMLTDLACLRSGWISAPYHLGWQQDELRHSMSLKPPRVVVCMREARSMVADVLREMHLDAVVIAAEDLMHAGDDVPSVHAQAVVPTSGTTATIVFTSGTGGNAKAAVLTHRALLDAAWQAYQMLGLDGRGANTLHWLPLSHMFGRVGLYIDWIAGSTGHYSRGVERLADDLAVARPIVLFAVPQVLTRLRTRIEGRVRAKPPMARMAFSLLRRLAALAGRLPPAVRLAAQALVRRHVFPAVHAPLGGRLAVVVVGGAPVDESEKHYFESLGIAVREGFGMTETAGVAAVQPLHARSTGAGKLLPSVQARIVEDGELLLRGPSMLSCYVNAEAYDAAGWFHTGDIADISATGDLCIRGRMKDIIIPESGENISPARIEALVCRHPWIEDACLIGDRRPCLIVVLALSQEGRQALVREGRAGVDHTIEAHLTQVNVSLAKYERIYGYVLAQEAFSIVSGELTVTNKKKRPFIADKYRNAIDACYATLRTTRRQSVAATPGRSYVNLSFGKHQDDNT